MYILTLNSVDNFVFVLPLCKNVFGAPERTSAPRCADISGYLDKTPIGFISRGQFSRERIMIQVGRTQDTTSSIDVNNMGTYKQWGRGRARSTVLTY